MQAKLNLDVEKRLPEWLRRKLTIKGETLYPNKRRNPVAHIYYDGFTLQKIAKSVVDRTSQVLNETTL